MFETLAALRARPSKELTQAIANTTTVTTGRFGRSMLKVIPERDAEPRRTEFLKKSGAQAIERVHRW